MVACFSRWQLSWGGGAEARGRTYRPALERLETRAVPAGFFQQTNLVSDQAGVALIQDPDLIDARGISLNQAGGAFWVSDAGSGKSTLYTGDFPGRAFAKAALTVTIPGGVPTGTVFNGSPDFVVSAGGVSRPALFLFASLTGNITGWNPAVPPPAPSRTAQVGASVPDAVYTGLAIGQAGGANFLYAADFAGGKIDVFDKSFNRVPSAGGFMDHKIDDSYVPFNIQNLGGELYVTFAHHKGPGHGSGFVDVFDTSGHLLRRLIRGNHLKEPWGLALAPSGFGPFGGALIVGNHGNGRIHAYDATSGKFLGRFEDATEERIEIDGLWGLSFGNGVSAGDRNALYFAAGPDDGTHGLFGSLRFVAAEPPGTMRSASLVVSAADSGGGHELFIPPPAPASGQQPPDSAAAEDESATIHVGADPSLPPAGESPRDTLFATGDLFLLSSGM